MIITIIGSCATVSIEISNVIVNNAVNMAADVIKFNVEELIDEISPVEKMNLRSRALFRNIIRQTQDFDQCVDFQTTS